MWRPSEINKYEKKLRTNSKLSLTTNDELMNFKPGKIFLNPVVYKYFRHTLANHPSCHWGIGNHPSQALCRLKWGDPLENTSPLLLTAGTGVQSPHSQAGTCAGWSAVIRSPESHPRYPSAISPHI